MKNNKTKSIPLSSIVFFLIIIIVLSFSIGYSAYSSNLTINGSLVARGGTDVRVTNVVLNTALTKDVTQKVIPTFTENSISTELKLSPTSGSIAYYDVTVINLSSNDVLITNVDLSRNTNLNTEYVLNNLVVNKTKIPAAGTYTFQVGFKFRDNIISKILGLSETIITSVLGISLDAKYTVDFTFYKVPQYSLEVTTLQNDASISFMINDNIVASGNGYLKHLFNDGEEVTYKATYNGITKTETIKMTKDTSRTINLDGVSKYTITINPKPSDAVVTINYNGNTCATGIGVQSCTVPADSSIEYIVTRVEYEDYTNYYKVNSNYTLDVNLVELSWLPSQIDNEIYSSATTNTTALVNNHPGYYLIDVYGGSGAVQYYFGNTNTGYGGESGHVYGVVYLEIGDELYYTIGGNAQKGTSAAILTSSKSKPGANGGGQADQRISGSGGGYTALLLNTSVDSLTQSTIETGNVLFIAGGGGGAPGPTKNTINAGNGGAGGSNTTTATKLSYGTVFSGLDGTIYSGASTYAGTGGSITGGTCSVNNNLDGTFLAGGESKDRGGAGGAGYYGGAGGAGKGSSASGSNVAGGGGGGSSFISSKVTYENLSSDILSKVTSTNPSKTGSGGSIKITFIGKTL